MRFPTAPRKSYPSDLTDEQWLLLDPLLPPSHESLGRPREVDFREVINAILYLNRTGCHWDMLPHDLPPKSTTYGYFAQWRDDGTWQRIIDALRTGVRTAAGCEPTPSAASVESLAANAILSWILWACCWQCRSPPPRSTTQPPSRNSLRKLLPMRFRD